MTAKEYLGQLQTIKARLENFKGIKDELRDQQGRVLGVSYDNERVQTSVHGDAMFKKICKLLEIEAEYDKALEEQALIQQQIIKEIHFLNSAEEIRVLYLRYVECLTLEEISGIMMYSERHVRRIRDKALQSFEQAFPDKFK